MVLVVRGIRTAYYRVLLRYCVIGGLLSTVSCHLPQGLLIVTLNGVKGLKSLLQVEADSPIKTFRFFVASSSE